MYFHYVTHQMYNERNNIRAVSPYCLLTLPTQRILKIKMIMSM